MSEREQWEKHFRAMDQKRAQARYEKDLVRWAESTSRRLEVDRIREKKNGLSPLRLHQS